MEVSEKSDIWYAVVNIFAASKKAGAMWGRAEAGLKESGVRHVAGRTGEGSNAMKLTCAACEDGYRKFIAVGGDGTVHDVLEGVMCFLEACRRDGRDVCLSDFTLSVIPLGSGNDWIKTAGIPHDIEKAASLLTEGKVARQDVVRVSVLDHAALPEEKVVHVSYMANVGGVGLDARVCERVNREKRRGKRGKILYVTALLYNIIHRVPSYARILCDGRQVFDGPFLSIAFGIGKYSGGGMRQTPDAMMDDGFLDMTVIPDLPIMKIAREAYKLFNGKLLTVKELVWSRARSIVVIPYDGQLPCQCVKGEPLEVDGEVVGRAPVRLEVLEDQLNILVPR